MKANIRFPEAKIVYVGDIELDVEISKSDFYQLEQAHRVAGGQPVVRLNVTADNGFMKATFSNIVMDTGWKRV